MKPLKVSALGLALVFAGAWDSALPVTLPAMALFIFAVTYAATSTLSSWRDRRRVAQLTGRLAMATKIDREPVFVEPGFAEMAHTLTELVQDAVRQEAWQVTANANEARVTAEIIPLDRYRKGGSSGFDVPTQLPEAVEMQRRLVDRVANLRSRRHLAGHHAIALDDTEDHP